MTLFIADVASYQQGLIPAALRPDIAALIIKCTQGTTYVDPYYAEWLAHARGTGLLLGAYHYVDGSSPHAQAQNLQDHIIDPTLAVMLDSEDGGLQQQLEVADAMTELGLHVRIDYLSRSYWAEIGSPDLAAPFHSRGLTLVNASYPTAAADSPAHLYPGDDASEWSEYGGIAPAIWQFTNAAAEAGQHIDVSAYRGSLDQLKALLTTTAPARVLTPEEDDMPMCYNAPRSASPGATRDIFKLEGGKYLHVPGGPDDPSYASLEAAGVHTIVISYELHQAHLAAYGGTPVAG